MRLTKRNVLIILGVCALIVGAYFLLYKKLFEGYMIKQMGPRDVDECKENCEKDFDECMKTVGEHVDYCGFHTERCMITCDTVHF